ncbi:MAG: hypothetical protein EZS28_035172 [Streblomastix strix]|uniref:CR-type domain-containing protein n=1 Tax=Streblomastix strix TaxID=222440 RepID=A0A5J4UHA4_9EUKA|nr:MAG: hypothetical protein EZS28_035172 [Streblomastix strix]
MICSACNGRGERNKEGQSVFKEQCKPCRGKGSLKQNESVCSSCGGRGERNREGQTMLKEKCKPCKGEGRLTSNIKVCMSCCGRGERNREGQTLLKKTCKICQGYGRIVHPIPIQKAPVNIIVGFHQTNSNAAQLILKNGFKPGNGGIAGGGIYFALNKDDTNQKAHHHGTILRADVDVGRAKIMTRFDHSLTGARLADEGYDSVFLPTGDGSNLSANEYVIYDPNTFNMCDCARKLLNDQFRLEFIVIQKFGA